MKVYLSCIGVSMSFYVITDLASILGYSSRDFNQALFCWVVFFLVRTSRAKYNFLEKNSVLIPLQFQRSLS